MAEKKPAGGGSGAGGAGKGPLKAGPGAARTTGGAGGSSPGAKAFTGGDNIAFKPGAGGGAALPHEAAHVVQQAGGKLKAGPGAKPR